MPPSIHLPWYRATLLSLAILSLSLFAIPSQGLAQAGHDSLSAGQTIVNDLKESVSDAGLYLTQPLRWDSQSWLAFAGTAAGTTALLEWADQPARDMFLRNRSNFADNLSNFGNFFGTGVIGGVAALGLYTTGLATHDSHVRLMGRHIVQSMAYAGILTTSIKFIAGRARPYMNLGNKHFIGFTYNNDYNALPSGHTTIATAICSSLAEDIGNTWASIGLYTVAGITVFARMYSDAHWSSDTFLGGVIGTTAGYFTVHAHDHKPGDTGLLVLPGLNNLTLVYNF